MPLDLPGGTDVDRNQIPDPFSRGGAPPRGADPFVFIDWPGLLS
ncbi:MAG TPA: hypothetical protein VGR26_09850 [Acidimicrobiales bacterium]|nr:hypothetical protein [Acidimicrobiales bacterium]